MSESQGHEHWEELAAGHALDALEPEETEAFTAHLQGCERCHRVLADHAFVAAQLGSLVEEQDDDVPSWESIRPLALPVRSAAPAAADDVVVSLAAVRQRRQPRLLAAAASLLLLAGAGGVALLTTRDNAPNAQQQVLASCSAGSGCHVVHLQGKADLVVAGGTAKLLATSLPAAPSGHVYVLWQLPRDGRPTMVGKLQTTGSGSVGEAHPLVLPYDSTAAFGISLEPAATTPTAPTDVVAVGSA
ncbi:MAG TPA: anti-sigma factor [Mycobacteriales bacterium]|nr:anti-sigma factor [Mycobacteriales bacterium]